MSRTAAGPQLPLDVSHRDGGDRENADLVAGVLDALPSPTVLIDSDGTMLLVNSAWAAAADLLGDDRLRVGVGANYYSVILSLSAGPTNHERVAALRDLAQGRREAVAVDYALDTDLGLRWFHLQASRADRSGRVVVTHTDVTSRVEAEQASAWQARHDHLTDLPNRVHLHELIDAELRRRDRGAMSVLFLDADGFKDVNDTLGHDVGDALLRELASRLSSCTRDADTVGRLGGDEFVVLCRNCDVEGALRLAERFQRTFDEPFVLGARRIPLTVSIGVATAAADDDVTRSTDLVRDADLAMYAAKGAGRNRVRVFHPDLRWAVEQKVLVAGELREAIEAGQLVLHYQPIQHLLSGEVSGAEALVRWQHPERGLVMPGDFIPVAEQNGLVVPLTRWVLQEATRQTAAWERAGVPMVTAVNISAAHFGTGTLVADVHDALAASGLAPDEIDLVVLASASLKEPIPGIGPQVAHRLGIPRPGAFDLNAGCAGFCYALEVASASIRAGSARNALVVGVERLTDVVDKGDRSTAVIFADGAGAAVVGASEEPGIGPVAWGSDGDQFNAIEIAAGTGTMTMAGQAVYRWATTRLTDTLVQAMEAAGVEPGDVDVFAPHQANLRIVESMTKKLGFREDVVVARDVVQSGNTSAASVPLALTALMESGEAKSGDLALVLGYGAGLTFAGQVLTLP